MKDLSKLSVEELRLMQSNMLRFFADEQYREQGIAYLIKRTGDSQNAAHRAFTASEHALSLVREELAKRGCVNLQAQAAIEGAL